MLSHIIFEMVPPQSYTNAQHFGLSGLSVLFGVVWYVGVALDVLVVQLMDISIILNILEL